MYEGAPSAAASPLLLHVVAVVVAIIAITDLLACESVLQLRALSWSSCG